MATQIPQFTFDPTVSGIQALPTKPKSPWTAASIKARFDNYGEKIKAYLNDTVRVAINDIYESIATSVPADSLLYYHMKKYGSEEGKTLDESTLAGQSDTIASGAILTRHLGDGAVTDDKISDVGWDKLGFTNNVLPVSKGGTGGTNAEAARAALGVPATQHNHTYQDVTTLPSSWTSTWDHSHSAATTSTSGFLSATDKTKLDGIAAQATKVEVTPSANTGSTIATIKINDGSDIILKAPAAQSEVGLADVAKTMGSSVGSVYNVGSATTPTFFSAGQPTACTPTTTVVQNMLGDSLEMVDGKIETALEAGTNITISDNVISATVPSVTPAGSSTRPVYIASNGTVTMCDEWLANSISGHASHAGYLAERTSSGTFEPMWVGDSNKPVFFDEDGVPQACSATVGSNSQPVYMRNGTITACSDQVGWGDNPIYMNNGVLTPTNLTKGSSTTPIYMQNGIIKPCDGTVGSATTPVYMNAGDITASSSTVGGASQPMYMNAGTLTACSITALTVTFTDSTTATYYVLG